MGSNTCHCLAPARWLLMVYSLPMGNMSHSIDAWAVCNDHIAEAAAAMNERNDMSDKVLRLRRDE